MNPNDRVLLTSLDRRERLPHWARLLSQGALVGLGTEDQVRAARRECAAFDNVMFVVGHRAGIPWQERWFDLIIDADPLAATSEMVRVLVPGGRIVTPAGLACE
jgi:SAM-dependent methyltransferase